ncbi:Ppx/GppA family phosphatase [Salisediminibacterium halotolerans]|uniref:Ppx/GppA family phosphatase n=1 Tax=Salisediminibacterium halotolerans TaxID=517425 RepID=UPI000F19E2A3|nr:Ppx/GppA family phosphatase [Salisediminibacterium halotolerans]RLJ78130.1 exopolyphosphatase/guanosine-5'-triphosphate,3'-diphosphate pyrophosphatase [Actinophytocola xinjiangensis]RPE88531.1 exopolyphosphatase/guanosine-5'-triphosphate,3'-diphosphate pyrophosphatase [Salisediminibacterium halotolerans]TWG37107.1 exopolyphosphatase/guanosine-5'-triphosphate,3'-diphosphate pyrophosphatase [Salisediminibacterium halotolerans]GEL08803.1 exopolyphosphatase [Salisediminibacterium halotolerans]
MQTQHIGIIDMGSNSIRFVIYQVDSSACYREIQNLKVAARLSTFIDEEQNMSNEGIKVILNTLKRFELVAKDYEFTALRGVATAAVRNASNRDEILAEIKKHSRFPIEILDESAEAYYGYLAVTNATSFNEGVTIDIGGGSTEITYFENRELLYSHSFPFGAVTLKQTFVAGDTPTKEEMKKIREYIRDVLYSLPWLKNKEVPLIGIGGTARNTALVHQARINYPLSGLHQYQMNLTAITKVRDYLSTLSIKKREKVDGLSKDRADIIIPAMSVFEECLTYMNSHNFHISYRGLRDGLFYEHLLGNIDVTHFPNVVEESFYQFTHNYQLNREHQHRIGVLSAFLLNELFQHHSNSKSTVSENDMNLLKRGASVFYIGRKVDPESASQHSFYLLANQSIDGFTHKERLATAFLASFKSKSQLKIFANNLSDFLSKDELKKYELLGSILRFAYGLNISGRNIVSRLEVSHLTKTALYLTAYHDGDAYFEAFEAGKYKKHLEKALKKTIHLDFIDESRESDEFRPAKSF